MGDDLTQAGEFITFAMAQMDILLSELRLEPEQALPIVTAVSQSAKSVNARGIFLAAKRVIDSYDNGYSQPKIDGRLMSLYKLVVQYHSGWQDIAPNAPELAAPISAPAAQGTRSAIEQKYQSARAVLTELMPFAGQEHGTLGALMGLDITLGSLQEEPSEPPTPMSDFETIMPDLINEALRFARVQGKSVSLSYAADDLKLRAVELTATYIRLEDIITDFISRKIASPSQRAQQGLARGGHIDISVLRAGANTKLSITCEGEQKEIELRKAAAPRPQSAATAGQQHMELGT